MPQSAANRAPYGSRKRSRVEVGHDTAPRVHPHVGGGIAVASRGKDMERGLAPELRDYNYGLFVPIERDWTSINLICGRSMKWQSGSGIFRIGAIITPPSLSRMESMAGCSSSLLIWSW